MSLHHHEKYKPLKEKFIVALLVNLRRKLYFYLLTVEPILFNKSTVKIQRFFKETIIVASYSQTALQKMFERSFKTKLPDLYTLFENLEWLELKLGDFVPFRISNACSLIAKSKEERYVRKHTRKKWSR